MKKLVTVKKLVSALALATLVASPAFAKTRHLTGPAADEAYASAAGPYAVVVDGQVVGADPDPNIRFQLERDSGLPAY